MTSAGPIRVKFSTLAGKAGTKAHFCWIGPGSTSGSHLETTRLESEKGVNWTMRSRVRLKCPHFIWAVSMPTAFQDGLLMWDDGKFWILLKPLWVGFSVTFNQKTLNWIRNASAIIYYPPLKRRAHKVQVFHNVPNVIPQSSHFTKDMKLCTRGFSKTQVLLVHRLLSMMRDRPFTQRGSRLSGGSLRDASHLYNDYKEN